MTDPSSTSRRRSGWGLARATGALGLCAALTAACGSGAPPEAPPDGAGPVRAEHTRSLMGTSFTVELTAPDAATARRVVDAAFEEVSRAEQLLSEWRPASEISEVNRAAGRRPVRVGSDLLSVVSRSLWASEITEGAFDITFAACGRLWSFEEPRIPADDELEACLSMVDFRRIELDAGRSTLFLPRPGMRIGIGAIGKGYGVDRAAGAIRSRGIERYLVDGGGDVRLASPPEAPPWTVGIAHPRRRGRLFAAVRLRRGAVVTSGDYEAYFERDGLRHHHILDPRTGRPARRSVAVTVLAPTATDADALATGLFVLGPRRGLELVEELPDTEALFLAPDLSVHVSRGFPELLPPPPPARTAPR